MTANANLIMRLYKKEKSLYIENSDTRGVVYQVWTWENAPSWVQA